jgi:iron complex outermembrane receptor protein
MYNRLENDDFNGDVYGGVSGFTMLDARAAYTLPNEIEIAIGIDNLTNERSYQSHPLQMRTGFIEARWSFTGDAR